MKALLLACLFLGVWTCQGLEHKKVVSSWDGETVPNFEYYTTPEIIQYFGYPAEIYHVATTDSYILEMHRIPRGINQTDTGEPRPVAFMVHCLLCSSSDYVMNFPDRALAYLMADAGYDVWMPNVRGNTYSRNHATLDPDKREFWQFTWHESAIYDITVSLDTALQISGQSQVHYVGFSMGTTMFFDMMSETPEYADKIVAAALMGPVAYDSHIKGPLRLLTNYTEKLDTLLSLTGHNEVLANGPLMDYLAEHYCQEANRTSAICSNIVFLISGYDPEELNRAWLPNILTHTPAGTSVHTLNHYAQLVPKNTFQQYDWGPVGNNDHYGSQTPPMYNISGRTPPIALFWGANDWLATPEDLVTTRAELNNVVLDHQVEWPKWAHMDFVWGIHAKEYVYDYLMDFLAGY